MPKGGVLLQLYSGTSSPDEYQMRTTRQMSSTKTIQRRDLHFQVYVAAGLPHSRDVAAFIVEADGLTR